MAESETTTTEVEATEVVESEAAAPAALEAGAGGGHDDHDTHGHPSPIQYIGIGLLLAVVTGIEVGIYYIDMEDWLLVATLLTLAAIKFGTVAAYFMHLKFDSLILRRLFVTGIVLAALIYTVVLFSMDVLVG